jgi:hypothetical protein
MSIPLERLFGSRTRVKLLLLFTNGIRRPYYVREMMRLTKERINSVRREIENLRKIGLLTTYVRKGKKYYVVNPKFPILDDLSKMMAKMGKPLQDRLFEGIKRVGNVKLVLLSGIFTQNHNAPTDLLIVGDVNEQSLKQFVLGIEDELGTEINFTVMTATEFEYRKNMNDSFLREVYEKSHAELLNTMGLSARVKIKKP